MSYNSTYSLIAIIQKSNAFLGLKKLLDQIRDQTKPIDRNDYIFPKLKSPVKRNKLPRDGESEGSNSRVEQCLLPSNNMLTTTKVNQNKRKLSKRCPHWRTNKNAFDKLSYKDEKIGDSKVPSKLLNFSTSLITSHYFNN
jgi:hypothetical protein